MQQNPDSDLGHPDANPKYDPLKFLWMDRQKNIIWLFFFLQGAFESAVVFFIMWELSAEKLAGGTQPDISALFCFTWSDFREIRERYANGHWSMKGTEDAANEKGAGMVPIQLHLAACLQGDCHYQRAQESYF